MMILILSRLFLLGAGWWVVLLLIPISAMESTPSLLSHSRNGEHHNVKENPTSMVDCDRDPSTIDPSSRDPFYQHPNCLPGSRCLEHTCHQTPYASAVLDSDASWSEPAPDPFLTTAIDSLYEHHRQGCSTSDEILSVSFPVDSERVRAKQTMVQDGRPHCATQRHRQLQSSSASSSVTATGSIMGVIANRASANSSAESPSPAPSPAPATSIASSSSSTHEPVARSECKEDLDCLNRFGRCHRGKCRGFDPDLSDSRLIRCVDGYRCTIKSGEIPGIDIGTDMQVIGVQLNDKCGAADPLRPTDSVFANSNRWQCDGDASQSCVFTAGVGIRRNKAETTETIRLCGCPNIDGDRNGVACDNRREFYVPLGRLSVQECIKNAHCLDQQFAYCVYDHCARPLGIAASAGLKVFQCMVSQKCDIQSLSSKALGEALKVLPIASRFDCGVESALDPDIIDDAALPCIVDINSDGVCEISLGFAKAMGTTRLCGCSGDKGGNGRDCDQLEDFDAELGLVNVGECVVDEDCGKTGDVCIDGHCVSDALPPYVTRSIPANNSFAVPPVTEIKLIWNENIQFTKAGRKLLITVSEVPSPQKWEMEVRDPSTYRISEAGYSITIKGREMTIVPDLKIASLPEGNYLVGYESAIVSDLQKNVNKDAIPVYFTVSNTVGCPFLYVTGYSTHGANPNGVYTSIEPINKHAAWKGGEESVSYYIYWKEKNVQRHQPGNWIISSKTDERHFIAYADLGMMDTLAKDGSDVRPPSGKWKKWEDDRWYDHPDVTMTCRKEIDKKYPKLIEIFPKIGAISVPTNNTKVMMRFSKPVTFGHWGTFKFSARGIEHNVTIAADIEAGMRGKNIKTDMQGVVELNLEGLDQLRPGTTYDLIGELGCVTDLSYNPWGPVGAGYLYFTTFGVGCAPFPEMGSAYIAEGNQTDHGSLYTVRCAPGYTTSSNGPKEEDNEEDDHEEDDHEEEGRGAKGSQPSSSSRLVRCLDGVWESAKLECYKDCPRYYELGPQYLVDKDVAVNHHGTVLTVTCAKAAVVIEGSGTATTTCHDGQWDPLFLKCGSSCGPFPSLGANYHVEYDQSSQLSSMGSTIVGARRIVTCAAPAVATLGNEPEFSVCEEEGWSSIQLTCHIQCPAVPEYDPSVTLSGRGNQHGSYRDIRCTEGYQPAASVTTARATCYEGKWQFDHPLVCMKDCPKFDRGSGYVVQGTGRSHGSTIEVACAEEALQESGGESERLTCENGVWSIGRIVCNGPCLPPEIVYGESYVFDIQQQQQQNRVERTPNGLYPQGTTGFLYCSGSSDIVVGIPPESIICTNGLWIPTRDGELEQEEGLQLLTRPMLRCERGCGPYSKDLLRYQDVGGVDRNQELAKRLAPSGTVRKVECRKGFSPGLPFVTSVGEWTCVDGTWVEGERVTTDEEEQESRHRRQQQINVPSDQRKSKKAAAEEEKNQKQRAVLTCLAVCDQSVLSKLFEQNVELVDPRRLSAKHGETFGIRCRQGFDLRLRAETPSSNATDTGLIQCINGRLKQVSSTFICTAPSCTDGILNGDEEGIDCGGSCPTRCSPCQLIREDPTDCVPTCQDRVRNGDEEDVDCGGKTCPPCRFCEGIPSSIKEGIGATIDRGMTRLHKENAQTQRFLTGTQLDVFCLEVSDQVSVIPIARFQTYVCDQRRWILSDGSRGLALKCRVARCDDGIQNGDEWDIDCGGSCPNQCPTCNDGVQNGDEASVDCGGSRCLPCNDCQVRLFKSLNTDVVKIEVVSDAQSMEVTKQWDTVGTSHGNRRRVSCRDPASSFSLLQCDNGKWKPIDGSVSIYDLSCQGGFVDRSDVAGLRENQFQSFHIPEISFPFDCPVAALKILASDLTSCCSIVSRLQSFFSSECGALLYSSKSSQVAGFCTGTCLGQLESILDLYDGRSGRGCALLPYLHVLKDRVFCSTGKRPPSSTSAGISSATGKPYQCFASVGETLGQMKDLAELRGPSLAYACDPSGCFSSNLEYFEVLRDITALRRDPEINSLSFSSWSTGTAARNLREVPADDVERIMDLAYEGLANLYDGVLVHFTTHVLGLEDVGLSDRTVERNESTIPPHRLLLDASEGFLFASTSSSAVRQWIINNRFSRNLLRFMCLADAEGNSCGNILQRIVTEQNSLSTRTCSEKCVLEVIRHMGQALYTEGKKTVSPYMATLGMLMRSYGRVACQKSIHGMTCGNLFGPSLDPTTNASPSNHGFIGTFNEQHARSKKETNYPNCPCPLVYVGDGRCDLQCYTPDCNYDEADCLFETMFPQILQRLNILLPISSSCHPFSTLFDCDAMELGLSSNNKRRSCREVVIDVLNTDGCCSASRWEILREALNLEITLRKLAASKYESVTGKQAREYSLPATVFSHKLALDRSTTWIETGCKVALDRSCSRGLRRITAELKFTLSYLSYASLFPSLKESDSILSTLLLQHLRLALSDMLAIPLADVGEMRFWAGSIFVEVLIDSGALIPEILKDLKSFQVVGTFESQINAAIKEFLQDVVSSGKTLSDLLVEIPSTKLRRLQETAHHTNNTFPAAQQLQQVLANYNFVKDFSFQSRPIQFSSLSTSEGPSQFPTTGTLDMPSYETQLINPSCSNFLGLSAPTDFAMSSEELSTVYEIDHSFGVGTKHGSTRQVRCVSGYEPSFVDSGPSPQFLVCDRGRWVTPIPGEKKLRCRKPCAPYTSLDTGFNEREMALTEQGGVLDGATRTVLCLAGYHPIDGNASPETLMCRNGLWDHRSLQCTSEENANQAIRNAACGPILLSDILTPNEVYALVPILTSPLVIESSPSSAKPPSTQVTIWSLRCSRGYVSKTVASSVAMLCVNRTLLATADFEVVDWEKQIPRGVSVYETKARERQHKEAKLLEALHIYQAAQRSSAFSLEPPPQLRKVIMNYTLGEHFSLMECMDDVRRPPSVLAAQPGLSDTAFYCLIFGVAFVVIALLMLAYYMRRTGCMKRPFLDPRVYDGKIAPKRISSETEGESKNYRQSEDPNHDPVLDDINHTAPGDDESQHSSSFLSPPSLKKHRPGPMGYHEASAYGDHGTENRLILVDPTSSEGLPKRIKSNRRVAVQDDNRLIYHERRRGYSESHPWLPTMSYAHEGMGDASDRPQESSSAFSPGPNELRIRGPHRGPLRTSGRQDKNLSPSVLLSNTEPAQSSDDDTEPDLYGRRRSQGHPQRRERQPLPVLQRAGQRSTVESRHRGDDDDDDDDHHDSRPDHHDDDDLGIATPRIESGASFYSEVEMDPERLRQFHLRHPNVNREMLDDLKSWSKSRENRETNRLSSRDRNINT